jgi:SAM-dependent methyltransferase
MNFDRYARQYDEALDRGLRLSGEPKEYFARGRLEAARAWFAARRFSPARAVEFGCGVGTNVAAVRALWPRAEITGLDVSEASLEAARERHAASGARFMTPEAYRRTGSEGADWVLCTGVLHHVPPGERGAALGFMRDLLRPGGCLTIFENNPYNPGARLVMRRIPFDRDAVMVRPGSLVREVRALGFADTSCRYLFIFPRFLRALRPLEARLAALPLGAQYGVFARQAGGSGVIDSEGRG